MHLEVTDTRTLKDDEPKRASYEYHYKPVSIGSHSANTLQLPELDVAEYHALLLPVGDRGDQWNFQPTTPNAVTYINGDVAMEPRPLEDGDVLKISYFELTFTLDLPEELELPEPSNMEELAKIKNYPLPARAEVNRGEDDIIMTPTMQRSLAEFGLQLRQCVDFASLLDTTLTYLMHELSARSAWMGVRRNSVSQMEFVAGKSESGAYTGEPWNLECFNYRCLSRHQHIRIPKTGQPDTQSALAVPILGQKTVLGLIYADTRRRTRVFDEADLAFLTVVSRFVASQLEAIIGDFAEQRAQLAGGELAFLHQVQERLDPKSVPGFPGLQLAAYAKSGSTSSGDFYDITKLPNGLFAAMFGHVEGSITRIALAMSEARAAFRAGACHADPPHVHLQLFNMLLFDENDPCSMSAVVMVMNPKSGALEYSMAGEIGAMLVDRHGEPRFLSPQDQPPVGADRSARFVPHKERLQEGELLAFFSPGCASATSSEGDILGRQRFIDGVCDNHGQQASGVMKDLLSDLGPYLKAGTVLSDVTVVLVGRS